MQIGEAAQRSGLTVKTVRYYANIGMVTPWQDVNTGYRVYNEDDVAKLQFVGKARRFNFSVEECRELLSLYEDRNRPSREVKALTVKKISEASFQTLSVGRSCINSTCRCLGLWLTCTSQGLTRLYLLQLVSGSAATCKSGATILLPGPALVIG